MSKLASQQALPQRRLFTDTRADAVQSETSGTPSAVAEDLGGKQEARIEAAKAALLATVPDPKRGRGRPKSEGAKPWVAAGVSKATWFRRKAREC